MCNGLSAILKLLYYSKKLRVFIVKLSQNLSFIARYAIFGIPYNLNNPFSYLLLQSLAN